MMRSMYSAVSGLRIHQSKMDTIGNNIANVNTVGFKKGQVTFQEVFSQVTRGASAPTGGKGGTNPQQVGMGSAIGSLTTVHTRGPGQRTDNPTDLMIDGEGFFVVSDDTSFNNKYYTRAGNFSLDRDGNLVTADGLKVLGYGIGENEEIDTSIVKGIQINMSETKAPTATENLIFKGNLDSRAKDGEKKLIDTTIKDSLGNSYKITFQLTKSDVSGQWDYAVNRVTDLATGNYSEGDPDIEGITDGSGTLTFDNNGKLLDYGKGPLNSETASESANLTIENEINFKFDKDGKEVNLAKKSGEFKTINIFNSDNPESTKNITQFANDMDLKPFAQDGNTSGNLEGFAIDASGIVTGVFTNGERKPLGQLMLAKFDNPMGLQKLGSNMFVDTRNSGEAQFGTGGASGLGAIAPGTLEMSNVDISLEFTEMITTQRGFQANSRIITTSDEMLQELVNLKR